MFTRRRLSALAGLCAVVVAGASAPGAQAAPVYKSMAGPKWQNASSIGTGRTLDCRTSNPYYSNRGCYLDLRTSGGCYFEIITATDLVLERRVPSPDCSVTVQGFVGFTPSPAKCVLTAPQSLLVTYKSRIPNSTQYRTQFFQASATFYPKSYADPFNRYIRQMWIELKGGSSTDGVGAGTIMDTLVATFVSPLPPSCPNPDWPHSVAYVKDVAADTLGSNPGASGAVVVAYDAP